MSQTRYARHLPTCVYDGLGLFFLDLNASACTSSAGLFQSITTCPTQKHMRVDRSLPATALREFPGTGYRGHTACSHTLKACATVGLIRPFRRDLTVRSMTEDEVFVRQAATWPLPGRATLSATPIMITGRPAASLTTEDLSDRARIWRRTRSAQEAVLRDPSQTRTEMLGPAAYSRPPIHSRSQSSGSWPF